MNKLKLTIGILIFLLATNTKLGDAQVRKSEMPEITQIKEITVKPTFHIPINTMLASKSRAAKQSDSLKLYIPTKAKVLKDLGNCSAIIELNGKKYYFQHYDKGWSSRENFIEIK